MESPNPVEVAAVEVAAAAAAVPKREGTPVEAAGVAAAAAGVEPKVSPVEREATGLAAEKHKNKNIDSIYP